jgi:hypothetical protein
VSSPPPPPDHELRIGLGVPNIKRGLGRFAQPKSQFLFLNYKAKVEKGKKKGKKTIISIQYSNNSQQNISFNTKLPKINFWGNF